MKGYSSKEIIRLLSKDKWYLVEVTGTIINSSTLIKKGKITVPHPNKDLPIRIVRSIFKQAGIDPQ